MDIDRYHDFIKVGNDVLNLTQIAHMKWADAKQSELQVTTTSGHVIKVQAEANQYLLKYWESIPIKIQSIPIIGMAPLTVTTPLDESALPVRIEVSYTITTGMPHTQYAWGNDVRWDQSSGCYYITGSYGPFSTDQEDRKILSRGLNFLAKEFDQRLFGSAYKLAEMYAPNREKVYYLDLSPTYSYVSEGGYNRLSFMVGGSGASPGEHFVLSVYKENENGGLQLVPFGQIKIYVD